MNVHEMNRYLLDGKIDQPGLFPKLEQLGEMSVIFDPDFGLREMPRQPGLIIIRGGRQLGKSTWLEKELRATVVSEGPGSALYLNGDELTNQESLYLAVREVVEELSTKSLIRRLFIDEITAIPQWEKALKRLSDQGFTKDVLIITTGSKMIDLRRGTEKLPGRKGQLDRTSYRFTPVSYKEFKAKTKNYFPAEKSIWAYILTGGSPVAINALISKGKIPNYVVELTKDWVFSETSLQSRSVGSMKAVIQCLLELGGLPLSMHAVAEEAGLANNTVAQGYVDLLKDLGCLSSSMQLEANKFRRVARKASKYHFIYLLLVTSFMKNGPTTIEDIEKLPSEKKGKLLEWLVASEVWRRAAISGEDEPEQQYFWTNGSHEVDFLDHGRFIEVKLGKANPSEFSWFPKVFPKKTLEIICQSSFDLGYCASIDLESFLMG